MADIFISYAKADRELADKLATMLEAEGWSVWWDKSLGVGETYRDEIMKQLTAARAVIAIWSGNSIKSDWVRAEAGRAKADGKLIPVKTQELTYPDIPLPFGEMHTENLNADDLVKAAVVAQLAKPQVAPSSLRMAGKTVRLQLLSWIGIVGGAVTIFANLRGLFVLADWARWLVTHWQELTQAFWSTLFGWIGIRLSPALVMHLSFGLFIAMIAVSSALRSSAQSGPVSPTGPGKLRAFLKWMAVYVVYLGCGIGALALMSVYDYLPSAMVMGLLVIAFLLLIPAAAIAWASKQRLQSVVLSTLLLLFWVILVVAPMMRWLRTQEGNASVLDDYDAISLVFASLFAYVGMPIYAIAVATLSPIKLVNQRLVFLSLGALVLVVLNQVSTLGLQQLLDAPKG